MRETFEHWTIGFLGIGNSSRRSRWCCHVSRGRHRSRGRLWSVCDTYLFFVYLFVSLGVTVRDRFPPGTSVSQFVVERLKTARVGHIFANEHWGHHRVHVQRYSALVIFMTQPPVQVVLDLTKTYITPVQYALYAGSALALAQESFLWPEFDIFFGHVRWFVCQAIYFRLYFVEHREQHHDDDYDRAKRTSKIVKIVKVLLCVVHDIHII